MCPLLDPIWLISCFVPRRIIREPMDRWVKMLFFFGGGSQIGPWIPLLSGKLLWKVDVLDLDYQVIFLYFFRWFTTAVRRKASPHWSWGWEVGLPPLLTYLLWWTSGEGRSLQAMGRNWWTRLLWLHKDFERCIMVVISSSSSSSSSSSPSFIIIIIPHHQQQQQQLPPAPSTTVQTRYFEGLWLSLGPTTCSRRHIQFLGEINTS